MKINTVILLTGIALLGAVWSYETSKKIQKAKVETGVLYIQKGPPCVQMYDYLDKYSKKYNVPFEIAMGIAYSETGYKGAFHWEYDPEQTSTTGALGAMQVLRSTAGFVWGRKVSKSELLEDLDFNVETSMKYIKQLYDEYGQWNIALGYYNTGYPVVNNYAEVIMKNFKK